VTVCPSYESPITLDSRYSRLPLSFPQELPSRVWKQILLSADTDGDGYITVQEAENILEKIGAADQLTTEELAEALKEVGAVDNKIEVEVLKGMLTDKRGMGK